jgi:hypothetical protein
MKEREEALRLNSQIQLKLSDQEFRTHLKQFLTQEAAKKAAKEAAKEAAEEELEEREKLAVKMNKDEY